MVYEQFRGRVPLICFTGCTISKIQNKFDPVPPPPQTATAPSPSPSPVMWRRRPAKVQHPESARPGLLSITVPSSPSAPEPSGQTQRGSELTSSMFELTSSMIEPKKMANWSKRGLIQKVMDQAKDKDSKVFVEKIPRDIVIAFVETLEKAHQRLDMREYLLTKCDFVKYGSDANLVVEQLVGSQEGKHRFNGYYKEVIRRSVQMHIDQLIVEKKLKDISPDFQYPDCNDFSEKKRLFEPSDPVFELVHRIREEEFVMDLNPEVELEKIKTCDPHFYHVEFIARQPPPWDYIPVKSRTVRLGDIPPYTSQQEVMELFSDCGGIECVQMTRDIEFPDKPQVAIVTFKELEGRDKAFTKDLKIDNQPIRIVPTRRMQRVNLLEPVDVRVGSDAEPAKENAESVDNMLQILSKYWFCSQRYQKSNLLAAECAVDDWRPDLIRSISPGHPSRS